MAAMTVSAGVAWIDQIRAARLAIHRRRDRGNGPLSNWLEALNVRSTTPRLRQAARA
ncbi:MAG: hypothetical protein FJ029_01785 [Actinobacteria bacterium]|nr:hypothetical protein [Actinomycetota bacterium]